MYPAPIWIDYPVLLDQPAPHLLAYTPENAIAEKYQAMVELDKANSRMKDFHDIWMLAQNLDFDGKKLSEAIRRTFAQRKTKLPESVPIAFTPEFFEDKAKQIQWQAFLSKGLATKEAVSLAEVVEMIRGFLIPPTEALVSGRAFDLCWKRVGRWATR